MGQRLRILGAARAAPLVVLLCSAASAAAVCGSGRSSTLQPPSSASTAAVAATAEPVILQTASDASLSSGGITLSLPPLGTTPQVSREEAVRLATGPNEQVIEVALAEVDSRTQVPPIHPLAWVVSVKPIGGFAPPSRPYGVPSSVPTAHVDYDLIVIDASNGTLIFGYMGAN